MRKRRRPYRGRRRRRNVPADVKTHRRIVRICLCLAIMAVMTILRMVFPDTFAEIGSAITKKVDFKGAFSAIGEGISGKTGVKDTVQDVFSYMSGSDGEEASADDLAEAPEQDEQTAAPDKREPDDPDGQQETESGDNSEDKDAMAAEFAAAQSVWASCEMPDNVTYDFVPLDIHTARPSEGEVSSSFGFRDHPDGGGVRFHYGTDFAGNTGDDVVSFADGSITAIGESSTLGLYVMANHDGARTLYAHLDSVSVASGDAVTAGEKIGTVGESGNATAPCLHFELSIDDVYVNPEYYV